jgi:hypothetical protein
MALGPCGPSQNSLGGKALTNNAYRLGIAAAGLSLFWAGSAQAVAPVVSDIPDVVISDSEDNIGGTDNNYFVFTNAFTFDNYVSDADTPVNTLKWSFDEGTDGSGDATTRYFNINAKQSVAVGDAAIATAQANPASRLSPALANDIRTSPTASFRDVVLTPGSGSLTSAFPSAAANILARHAAGKVVRLYVSDSTFVVSNDIIVSAVDSNTTSSVDALSGGFSVQKTDAFASSAGWGILGQSGANFTGSIGTRQHNPSSTALEATVASSSRARIIGWLEDESTDVPYSSIGTRFVRGKYSVFYTGPGDSLSNTLANQVPNFRLSLRTKGVVNSILEINSNAQLDGSPAQLPVTREIGPSKNAAQPSIYRVDLDPIDVPFLTGSTTEGVQRGFETLVGGAYPFATGTLSVTDSSIGTYPALNLGSTPVKTYAAGGTANAADFDNANITVARLGYSVSEIFRYLTGIPTASDYFNPTILNFTVNTEANSSITRSPSGIVVNTAGLANTRIAVLDASFGGGVFGDTDATRLRAESDRIYVVSARIQHGAASSTTPYTRFNVRTLGFGYNASLDLLGGRGIASAEGLAACAQVMPGTGTAVPGSGVSGSVYNLILNSPLNGQIRNDVAGTLATKFPNATAQPGPGVNSASLRDINIGFTIVDSLSLVDSTTVDSNEVASNLTLNRVEIRSFPQFND